MKRLYTNILIAQPLSTSTPTSCVIINQANGWATLWYIQDRVANLRKDPQEQHRAKQKMFNLTRTPLTLISLCLFWSATTTASADTNPAELPLEEIRLFTEIFGKIKSEYVDQVDDRELLQSAIEGMLSGLDPHSDYMDAENLHESRIDTEGKFGGLGIEVSMEDGFVLVVSPIDDTPAQRANIQAGDLIIRLDDQSIKGMSLNDAVKKMRGAPGTNIKLTIVRGTENPFEVTLTRAVIKITSVKSKLLEDQFGYIRITQFQTNTAESLHQALKRLNQEANNNIAGLILDLRNNPGGVLSGAVAVSDTFLTKGLIVSTQGRSKEVDMQFSATSKDYSRGAPLVVLVNEGSASASEIVAGALQDHGRAIIMGRPTFGKGSVQTILPMNNGAALKITTARYYTPSGNSIQATGIKPDIVVQNLNITANEETSSVNHLREQDLRGHLENENGLSTKEGGAINGGEGSTPSESLNSPFADPETENDYLLKEAITLLKGLSILNKNAIKLAN